MLSGVTILVTILLGAFVFGMFFKNLEDNLKTNTEHMIDYSLDTISRYMFERYSDIVILTDMNHPIMTSNNIKNKLELLHTFEQSSKSYLSFSIYDDNGKKILDTRNIGINDIANSEEFFNTAIKGEIYYDKIPIFSSELNQYTIRFSGPIYDQDKNITGVLVANTSILTINTILEQDFQNAQIDIISKEGIIIFSNYNRTSLFTQIDSSLLKQYSIGDYFIFNGVQKTYLDYPSSEWTMLAKMSKDDLFRELSEQQVIYTIISSIIVIIVISFSLWLSRTISSPLHNLRNGALQIQKGDYITVKEEGTDETKELASAFNAMSKSIKRYNKNLEDLHAIVDIATEVSITDPNGKIIYVNDKFCETSKYTRSELIGQNHRILKSGLHSSEFFKNMWDTINRGEIWSGEIKNKNKNNKYYWVKTVIMPFKDDLNNIQQFMSIRTDITEIHESREKINEQLVQLKKTNKQKDEFISMISHELKSPIFPIIGYCDLLKDPELSKNFNSLHLEALDEITSNAKKLQRITEDLLDVHRIHMKKLQYNITKLSLAEFATRIIKEHITLMEKKQIEFCVLPVEDQIIESDVHRLMQVITNMIRNAVDFVPDKNGKITVSIHSESEYAIFSVKDNGTGIAKEKQHELFTPFYQVDTSATRSHGGTGLGLAICKGLVEGLGGKIWIESEEGKGSTFFFSIPLKHIEKKDEDDIGYES
jgi:PAS domain S-box-containing protein